jgi:hypothetical protein
MVCNIEGVSLLKENTGWTTSPCPMVLDEVLPYTIVNAVTHGLAAPFIAVDPGLNMLCFKPFCSLTALSLMVSAILILLCLRISGTSLLLQQRK